MKHRIVGREDVFDVDGQMCLPARLGDQLFEKLVAMGGDPDGVKEAGPLQWSLRWLKRDTTRIQRTSWARHPCTSR